MKNNRGIFWGMFLIAIGILYGLKNFGFIDFYWYNIFRLWPFILVFWGITLLPVKQNIKMSITLLTLIAFFAALVLLPSNNHWARHFHFNNHHISIYDNTDDNDTTLNSEDFNMVQTVEEGVEKGKMKIDFGAGNFKLAQETNNLFEFNATQTNGKFIANTEIEDGEAMVKITQKKVHIDSDEDMGDKANLKINPDVKWDIELNAGAADLDLDLQKFKIGKLDINAGATDMFIELGNKSDTVWVDLDAGVSNIEISIPAEMSGEIHTSTLLTTRTFIGFDEIKKGLYRTPDFDNNPKKVFINADAAAAAIRVQRK